MITSVLLTILKIILIILLCVISLITLIMCAVLFVPIRYNIDADKYDEINVCVNFSWLFKAVRFVYIINKSKPEAVALYVFGFKLLGKKANMHSKPTTHKEPNIYRESKTTQDNIPIIKPSEKSAKQHTSVKDIMEENPATEERCKEDTVNPKILHEKTKKKDDITCKKTKKHNRKKVKHEKNAFSDILRQIWEYQYKKEIFNSVTLLLKRIINTLSNVKIKAHLKVGGGEPHKTGYILALIYAISGTVGFDISAEADCPDVVLKGAVGANGKIVLGSLAFAFLAFIFNKRVWPIVKKIIF